MTPPMDARPVICAFEPSAPARLAARAAAWLATELRAPLELVHVFDPGAQPAFPREGGLIDPVMRQRLTMQRDERERARARRILDTVADDLGAVDATCLVLDGPVLP